MEFPHSTYYLLLVTYYLVEEKCDGANAGVSFARAAAVLVSVIRNMIDKWETPDITEAQTVEYQIISR